MSIEKKQTGFRLFWGWKIFDKVLVPKNYKIIPFIQEIEYSLLAVESIYSSYENEYNELFNIDNLKNAIINRLNNTGNFMIYDMSYIYCLMSPPMVFLNMLHTRDITKYTQFEVYILNDKRIDIISNVKGQTEDVLKFNIKTRLKTINPKFADFKLENINYKLLVDITEEIKPKKITHILIIPHIFHIDTKRFRSGKHIQQCVFGKINLKEKYSKLDILGWVVKSEEKQFYKYNKDQDNEFIYTGNFRLFSDINGILKFFENTEIYTNYVIYQDVSMINKDSEKINKYYFYSPIKPQYRILEKNPMFSKESLKSYLNCKTDKIFMNSDVIINGNLRINLDDKLLLELIFKKDKSIIPLSVNLGQVKNLFSETEIDKINSLEPGDLVGISDLIVDKLLEEIKKICDTADFKNKNFIIKNANGSNGIGISGFNCFGRDFDKESKKNFIKLVFDINTSIIDFPTNEKFINKMLNTYILIQEYISSPTLNIPEPIKFKSRVYVLLEQEPDFTIKYHLYDIFNIDPMPNIDTENFFNVTARTLEKAYLYATRYISNLSRIEIPNYYKNSEYIDDILDPYFNYEEIMNNFIQIFADHFTEFINKNKLYLFCDMMNNRIPKKIFKILSIDTIFDSNDSNKLKIIEINTAGAIYENNFINDVYNYILFGNLTNFYSSTVTNPPQESTAKISTVTNPPQESIDKKYLKSTRYEIKYY
jgi:hypothetical protein